jgi:hypothetical protein
MRPAEMPIRASPPRLVPPSKGVKFRFLGAFQGASRGDQRASVYKSVYKQHAEGPSRNRKGPLTW